MQQIESRFEGQAKSRKISPSGETSFVPAELCYYELPDKLFEHHSVQNDVELQAREQRKSFFQKTIKLLWKRGNIIIVGRGANNVLKDEPDVLRVRLIAPLTTRAYRLVRKEGLNYEEALDNAVGMDSLRTRYVYESYQRHIEEETLYDLVLNTERLRLKAAVGLIVDTAQALEGSLETQVLRADRPWV
jgi:cytidylate kinase